MDDKKVQDLERKVSQLSEQVKLLTQQVNYLKRENQRAKSNLGQIAGAVNRLS